jgi:hypothetical protein
LELYRPSRVSTKPLVTVASALKGKAMTLPNGKKRFWTALAVAGAMLFAASSANAAMSRVPAAGYSSAEVQLTAGGCGYGSHRLLGGGCTARAYNRSQAEYLTDLRPCQPGTHSQSFPSAQGYRCVVNRR